MVVTAGNLGVGTGLVVRLGVGVWVGGFPAVGVGVGVWAMEEVGVEVGKAVGVGCVFCFLSALEILRVLCLPRGEAACVATGTGVDRPVFWAKAKCVTPIRKTIDKTEDIVRKIKLFIVGRSTS